MPFTILAELSENRWTANIGPGENLWDTEAEAMAAIADLEAAGLSGPWRVVDSADLENLELYG